MVHASCKTGPAERFDKKEKANMILYFKNGHSGRFLL